MARTSLRPTDDALDVDRAAIPIGSYVRWTTDKGYNGRQVDEGLVTNVTAKSYVVEDTLFQSRARIPRDESGQPDETRRLTVLMTPREFVLHTEQQQRERAAAKAEYDAKTAADNARLARLDAETAAGKVLALRYPEEFDRLVQAVLADPSLRKDLPGLAKTEG